MEKLKVLLFIIVISFTTPSLRLPEKSQQGTLQSGWYIISNDSGTHFELNHTKKYYDIDPVPIVTTKHLISINVNMSPKVNGKSFPTITFTFDDTGTGTVNKALAEYVYKRQIGLILDNKLKLVAEAPFSIKGPSISLSSPQNDLEQLKSLKEEINDSH